MELVDSKEGDLCLIADLLADMAQGEHGARHLELSPYVCKGFHAPGDSLGFSVAADDVRVVVVFLEGAVGDVLFLLPFADLGRAGEVYGAVEVEDEVVDLVAQFRAEGEEAEGLDWL